MHWLIILQKDWVRKETEAFTLAGTLTQEQCPIYQVSQLLSRGCALWAAVPSTGGEDYRGKEAHMDRILQLTRNPSHVSY